MVYNINNDNSIKYVIEYYNKIKYYHIIMSNLFPLCPCPNDEDPRIKCFLKSIEDKKENCNLKLLTYYKSIIQNIRDIFKNSITTIDKIENLRLQTNSQDYVNETIHLFEEFVNAVEKYIYYRLQIQKEEEYLKVQECFYINCNLEIRKQIDDYKQYIELFQNFLRERNIIQKSMNQIENQHNNLIDTVIKMVISLYFYEVKEYTKRFNSISVQKNPEKKTLSSDGNYDCKNNNDCQILNYCLNDTEEFKKSCDCINNVSIDVKSKKKACEILGPCQYINEKCSKKEIHIDFAYNNFCESINGIKNKKKCKNTKIQKDIFNIYKYKDTEITCPNISTLSVKDDCLKILEEGKKCCLNYFETKETFFKSLNSVNPESDLKEYRQSKQKTKKTKKTKL